MFIIREERAVDLEAIRAVHRAAFAGDVEATLVDCLRAAGEVLLSLVAADEGEIVGHVLFSRLPIETPAAVIPAAALAPLAVLPGRQRQGIGTALVRDGLTRLQVRGVPAVVVLGDPAYYRRFGFRAKTAHRLKTPWPGPHLMAVELTPGGLGNERGVAHYAAAFDPLPET